ncbi:b29d4030-e5d4-4845-8046-44addc3524ed [Sclerotinia trifoliorum]|uniref:B29d4030-e5d4-4845-8046-44addc3524ed n=1 Tax=Sclerotinia trifoliorum TaxID=28548 RepID=A0A8H2VVP0_9HELO|nr:b29d4030-e5d4-4845-8046-44addc3524ed [Sclerotinia trifoliorum]
MLFTNTKFLSVLAAATAVKGAPIEGSTIEARGVVAHDSINPWPENVPGGALGNTLRRFEPYIHIAHGCQPYSAVDGNGNTSGGLQDTGNVAAGCSDPNKGQTYVRGGWSGGKYGIMYAWYFPKDQPAAGNVVGGHRHDWEYSVIWVNNPEVANPQLLGGVTSSHNGVKKTTSVPTQGTRPKVEYFVQFPTNHEMQFTNTLGRDLPMMWYDFLPTVSKNALDTTDFVKANCPFNHDNFEKKLAAAQI